MMDLDHFKEINDRFGHGVGDEALRCVAAVLQKNVRDYDFVGRWGGEEFLAILPGASLSQACLVAERIRTSVENVRLGTRGAEGVALRASLGVACNVQGSVTRNLDELLEAADDVLYRAKEEGRNRVCFQAPGEWGGRVGITGHA
jgi:diguanylate cyclase (GGDEF)-like protein